MYRRVLSAVALALACGKVLAETATVPWAEFKDLYTEHLEKRLRADGEKAAAPGYTLRRADFHLRVEGDSAIGELLLGGETLAEPPVLVPLLGADATIADVREQQGGTVVRTGDSIALRSDVRGEFQVRLDLVIPVERVEALRRFEVQAPQAIANALDVTLPDGARFVSLPGVAGPDGRRHLPAGQRHTIRFLPLQENQNAMPPSIDLFTEISLHQQRLRMTTLLAPQETTTQPFEVALPAGARVVSSTIREQWWRPLEGNRYRIELPADLEAPVEIVSEIDLGEVRRQTLQLPFIDRNLGAEGNFAIREPVQTRIHVDGAGLAGNLPADQLPEPIRARWPSLSEFEISSDNQPFNLSVESLKPVAAPELVLDAVTFTTRYGEDGQLLTTLRLDVPADAGPRLILRPVPGAEVWSVQVNGERRSILDDDGRSWVVPLDGKVPSRVEIALLGRRDKPALAGKLDLVLPATGLTARAVYYGLTLPQRLELVSMESDLSPEAPANVAGNDALKPAAYVFSRSFYRGEEIPIALMYREPLNVNTTVPPTPVAATP
jgi:hypothetical protein